MKFIKLFDIGRNIKYVRIDIIRTVSTVRDDGSYIEYDAEDGISYAFSEKSADEVLLEITRANNDA
jgi:hypothetical protein